jgi:hypothetical protein
MLIFVLLLVLLLAHATPVIDDNEVKTCAIVRAAKRVKFRLAANEHNHSSDR